MGCLLIIEHNAQLDGQVTRSLPPGSYLQLWNLPPAYWPSRQLHLPIAILTAASIDHGFLVIQNDGTVLLYSSVAMEAADVAASFALN